MKSTKFFAAFLAVLMLFGTLAASAAGFNDLTYKDQPDAFKKALMLSEMGVIKGDDKGNANLGANVTRAEMAAFIFRLGTSYVDIVGGTNSTTFKDIPADAWYISNVVWCAENGIIEGRDKETFDPQADVSYDEAIKMVCTLLGYKNKSYPLGYNLAFRDILKKNNTTLEKALPKYKGDIVGKRYPITRGEVIDLLNIAYTADLVKADGTSTGKTLATSVWGSWGEFKENNVIVVATPAAALPGYTVAAKDKIAIATYDAKKVISATAIEIKPADIGLASTDCLGSAVSYYTMTKAGKTAQLLSELTVVTPAKYYDNAAVSYTTKVENKVNVDYVTVAGNEFKASEAKKYTAEFTAKDKANFTGTASNATVFFADLKAGKKVYAVALDLFADGTIEYFDYECAEIGILGKADKKISKDKDATEIKALVASSVADVTKVKKSTLTVLAGNYFTALINNKAAAKENDIVVFYTFGAGAANKLTVIDEILTPFAGTVTKVVNTEKFTVEKADGSKTEYTINTAAAPFINANVLASGAVASLMATVKANFVVYNNKILVAYQDEDKPVTPETPDYSGNKIALFYGLAARDIITESKYVWDPNKAAFVIEVTPSYKYYALVAYEDDPSKIVKVPVSGKAGCIGSCVALEAAFDQAITLSYVPGSVLTQKPMASCQTHDHQIGGIETDGSAAVILTEILDSKNKGTGVFDISENITLKALSAKTSEELVQGDYIVQNFVTGKYELYKEGSNIPVKRFTTDANSVVIELTALKQDDKANLINAEAGQHADYSAKKSALGTISGQDEFIAGTNTCLVAGTTGNFIFEGDILRKAVVLKDDKASGQIISKAADKTKEPYAFQILQSVDSISVDGLVATVAYTTYNPATKATTQATISVTADKADNVQKYGYDVAKDLSAFVGKVLVKALTVDAKTFKLVTKDCFKDLSEVGTKASLAQAADKKSINLAGSYVDAKIEKIDANADNSVYYVTATVGGRVVTLKLADSCNIIQITGAQPTIQGFQKVTISAAVAVEKPDEKKNMVYNTDIEKAAYRFFVDSDLNIVFGAVIPN